MMKNCVIYVNVTVLAGQHNLSSALFNHYRADASVKHLKIQMCPCFKNIRVFKIISLIAWQQKDNQASCTEGQNYNNDK